jgi:cobalt/nickel transport system permease protein
MHIPDGFLDAKTIAAASVLSAAGIGRALRNVRRTLTPRKVPLMGLASAFLFVAQMINFPVIGGTSGHLLGAVLAAILLGPDEAILVMTVVLAVQAFLFADGGVLALGANLFNMAIVAPLAGFAVYRLASRPARTEAGRLAAVALAAWSSTVLAAAACAGELSLSGAVAWPLAFPAMTAIHMAVGLGEAAITGLVLAAVAKARPDLLTGFAARGKEDGSRPVMDVLIYGGLIVAGAAVFVLPFASKLPDGLEAVALRFGFASRAAAHPVLSAPLADYRVPGVGSLPLAAALAALLGAGLVFGLAFLVGRRRFMRARSAAAADSRKTGSG